MLFKEKLSVIVPCYNEELVINECYQQISSVLSNNFEQYEIIFVNDGSQDTTLEILNKISTLDINVKVINFSRNFGHQPAVTAGIHNCCGDIAIIIDADLQDSPSLFLEMVNIYKKEQCNVVYGVRRSRKGDSLFKKLTAKYFYIFMNNLSDVKIPLDTGDFRLIDRLVIDEFSKFNEKNKYIRGMISWIGFKHCPMLYDRDARFAGQTKYPLRKMLKFALTGISYFSNKPLKLALNLGFISIFIGLLLLLYVLFSVFYTPMLVVRGWASTLIVIVFFGGVQLLSIGVLGEYLGKIFDEVKGRPDYIIKEKINF